MSTLNHHEPTWINPSEKDLPITSQMSQTTPMKRIFCVWITSSLDPTRPHKIRSLAEACHRFTPIVAIRENESIFLDMTASLHLFQQGSFEKRIQILCKRFGLSARIGSADDAPTALAIARTGIRSLRQLPLESLCDFLSPFQKISEDPKLARQARALIDRFGALGFNCLDDFIRVPTPMLARRFGLDGVHASQIVQKSRTDAWPVFRIPDVIEERLDLFESDTMAPCSDLEPLLFAIRPLLERVTARLRARALRASAIQIEFEIQKIAGLRSVPSRKWDIFLPCPQGSTQALMPILRDRLNFDLQRDPLIAPVCTLHVTILETAPGHGAQSSFLSRQLEHVEAWDGIVGRLIQKLGPESVHSAEEVDRHVPEASWKRVPPRFFSGESVTSGLSAGDLPKLSGSRRPTRLLNSPEPLLREGEQLIREGRSSQRWLTTRWEGPERINGEWWRPGCGIDRDYFRVHTHGGELLWVYRLREDARLYLHGFFD